MPPWPRWSKLAYTVAAAEEKVSAAQQAADAAIDAARAAADSAVEQAAVDASEKVAAAATERDAARVPPRRPVPTPTRVSPRPSSRRGSALSRNSPPPRPPRARARGRPRGDAAALRLVGARAGAGRARSRPCRAPCRGATACRAICWPACAARLASWLRVPRATRVPRPMPRLLQRMPPTPPTLRFPQGTTTSDEARAPRDQRAGDRGDPGRLCGAAAHGVHARRRDSHHHGLWLYAHADRLDGAGDSCAFVYRRRYRQQPGLPGWRHHHLPFVR